jgi:hypothetical protein
VALDVAPVQLPGFRCRRTTGDVAGAIVAACAVASPPMEEMHDGRAELRSWYFERFRPKLEDAVSRKLVSVGAARALDDAMHALLDLPGAESAPARGGFASSRRA